MPRARRAVVLAGAAVGLLLLAAWQVPQWLDWSRYRATIEALATGVLGQPVTIRGPIALSLLPQPVLTATEVSVAASGPTDSTIQVAALRLRVGLWPLLGGRIDAWELVLRRPDLHIPSAAAHSLSRPHPPAWLAAFSARIENGRLTIGRIAFTDINAKLETLDSGALSAAGEGEFGGYPWRFTARVTAAGSDGAAGLNAAVQGQGRATGLTANFSGQLAADGSLAGALSGRGPDLAVLLPAPSVPFRVDGRVNVRHRLAALEDVALQIGTSPARATIALRIDPDPRLDIALSAGRFDLDAWLAALPHAGMPMPDTRLPIGIDLLAESAPLRGGTLEHLRASFELDGATFVLREASALLPGSAVLRLSGRMNDGDTGARHFDGDAWLDAPVPRNTLHWLGWAFPGALPLRTVGELPDGAAQRAVLSAHVEAGAGGIALRHVSGKLAGSGASGSLELTFGEPHTLGIDVSLDHLTIDHWLPRDLPRLDRLFEAASGTDLRLHLSARQALWGDQPIQSLGLDAEVKAGRIRVRRIEGTVRQGHVVAAAQVGDGGHLRDGKLAVTAADASSIAGLLPSTWRLTQALWHGPAELTAQFAGPPHALTISARLALAELRVDADVVANMQADTWDATVSVHDPQVRRLLAGLGFAALGDRNTFPDWMGNGPLSLLAHLAGTQDRLAARDFDLTVARVHTRGNLALDFSEAAPLVSGQVVVDEFVMPLPNGASSVPLSLDFLRGWRGDLRVRLGRLVLGAGPPVQDISASLSITNGVALIQPITGQLGAGTLTAAVTCDAAEAPPAISLQARLTDMDLTTPSDRDTPDKVSGRVNADVELVASGFSPAALLATLHGRLDMVVSNGLIGGFSLSQLKRAMAAQDAEIAQSVARNALVSGVTAFGKLSIVSSIGHGEVTIKDATLTGAEGNAQASGSLQLTDGTLDVRIEMQPPVANAPKLSVHLAGPIDGPNRTPDLTALARWMVDRTR